MSSKMVVDRQKSCAAVEKSIVTHGDVVAGSLGANLDPLLGEGETAPDWGLMLRLLGRSLANTREDLVAADKLHVEELADDAEARQKRDEAADRLRKEMANLRDVIAGAYGGDNALSRAGLDSQMAADPVAVLRQTERVIEKLSDPELDLGPPRVAGIELAAAPVVASLETLHGELREALDVVEQERREADLTQVGKNQQMAIFNRRFLLTAAILEAIYRYAEQDELADRVRPSRATPGRRLRDVGGDEDEDEETPAPEPAAAS